MSAPQDFWSRRKAAVEAENAATRDAETTRAIAAELAEREERSDEEILAELDLPDPDTLKPGDDVAAFMARSVPERLRRRALRKLWTLNPVLANLDGLNDYDDDYSVVSSDPVETTYRVGKGLLAHLQDIAREAERAEEPEVRPEPSESVTADAEEEKAEPEIAVTEPVSEHADPPLPTLRRMRFEFQNSQDNVRQTGNR